jgi:thiamine pyridinylase
MHSAAKAAWFAFLFFTQSCMAQEQKLRVALFPYLPGKNLQALAQRIEREFEALNQGIDLELRPFSAKDDFYDPLFLASLLKGDHPYDVVETDGVLLGTLMDLEAIAAWNDGPDGPSTKDLSPMALAECTSFGRLYGVPHWMCGYFIMTRNESVARARTLDEFTRSLEQADGARVNLVGDLLGSWDTAAIYLDAWADKHSADPQAALSGVLEPDVLQAVARLARHGALMGHDDGRVILAKENPCTNKTLDDNSRAPEQFGKGEADALFGYSERLHYAVDNGLSPKDAFINCAPLGASSAPQWFVDALVYRNDRKDEDAQAKAAKRSAATKFANYLNSTTTFGWIHAGEDLGAGASPRYLIPACLGAFRDKRLADDPIMKQIERLLLRGTCFPKARVPGVRRTITAEVEKAWARTGVSPAPR